MSSLNPLDASSTPPHPRCGNHRCLQTTVKSPRGGGSGKWGSKGWAGWRQQNHMLRTTHLGWDSVYTCYPRHIIHFKNVPVWKTDYVTSLLLTPKAFFLPLCSSGRKNWHKVCKLSLPFKKKKNHINVVDFPQKVLSPIDTLLRHPNPKCLKKFKAVQSTDLARKQPHSTC